MGGNFFAIALVIYILLVIILTSGWF
ncbi:conserved hypothetical protein [[Clostridium] ultunense Esp]|nr:conserved hypothetical protein [[Clostridium] ultunense Esp]